MMRNILFLATALGVMSLWLAGCEGFYLETGSFHGSQSGGKSSSQSVGHPAHGYDHPAHGDDHPVFGADAEGPPGQSKDKTPPGQEKEKNVPPGQQKDKNDPPGQQKDKNDPPGQEKEKGNPHKK